MAGKKKEINQSGIFQARFIEQHNRKPRTLDELAAEFGAVRQTVSKWMTGESVPDIISLVKIAKFYDVSTDYLLGCSDTMSVDVNVKAAKEYTGLTEAAVERLHSGLKDPVYHGMKIDDIEKAEGLSALSSLITSQEFNRIIDGLREVSKWAYLECALNELWEQYYMAAVRAGNDSRCPFSEEVRDGIITELMQALETEGYYIPKYQTGRLRTQIKEFLKGDILVGVLDVGESLDQQQFLVTKSIMSYLEKWIDESRQRAKQRFAKNC